METDSVEGSHVQSKVYKPSKKKPRTSITTKQQKNQSLGKHLFDQIVNATNQGCESNSRPLDSIYARIWRG